MITYEYPLNERTRTLLRLESVFDKALYFIEKDTFREHHAALAALFEIVDIAGRADLKIDLLQELEWQRQMLTESCCTAASESPRGMLGKVEEAFTALRETTGKIGQHVYENEWLTAIKKRIGIPGGVCGFDLPSYHHWQHLGTEERKDALRKWLQPLLPLNGGLSIFLRLLRKSGEVKRQIARKYVFQVTPPGDSPPQMLRIFLTAKTRLVPDISANKYIININFIPLCKERSALDREEAEVPFDLAICGLGRKTGKWPASVSSSAS